MQKATVKNDKRLLKLKFWREKVGLKQDDLAVLIGCKKANYCCKERGSSEIRLSELLKIQKAINQKLEKMGEQPIGIDDLVG